MFRMRAPWRDVAAVAQEHRGFPLLHRDTSVRAHGSRAGRLRPDLYQDFTFVRVNPLRIRPRVTRVGDLLPHARQGPHPKSIHEETPMSKRARKRRSRKGNAANHGRKPNA
jgi:hypothetical protein